MFKACSKCGKIHDTKYKCNIGIVYRGGEERRHRSKYAWEKKSLEIRYKANYLCEVCKDNGIYVYTTLEVHHIEKVKDNPDRLLDDYNLICLCTRCHKKADANKIDKDYLIKLVMKRES